MVITTLWIAMVLVWIWDSLYYTRAKIKRQGFDTKVEYNEKGRSEIGDFILDIVYIVLAFAIGVIGNDIIEDIFSALIIIISVAAIRRDWKRR